MLKQMRWHFIGAAMAAFTAVVLTLLCFVNLWNYHSMTDQQDEALSRLLEVEDQQTPFPREKDAPPFDDWAHFSPEVQYSLRFFSVHYDADGTVLRVNQDHVASLSEEDAKAYADAALAHQKAQGYESGYRYLVHTTDQETVVLFLNSERELQRMHSLLWITLVIAGVCLVVVFVLVVLLSRRAILPYLKNMEAQKQFITNASHELKTPLTAIAASADVLAMEHGDDEWVRNIQAQAARLAKLITNLVTRACVVFPQRCALGDQRAVCLAVPSKGKDVYAGDRRRADRGRGPDRHPADGFDPAGQRPQVFPRRRVHCPDRPAQWEAHGAHRLQHRGHRPADRHRPSLRALLSGGRIPLPCRERDGHRAVHCQGHGGGPRREDLCPAGGASARVSCGPIKSRRERPVGRSLCVGTGCVCIRIKFSPR